MNPRTRAFLSIAAVALFFLGPCFPGMGELQDKFSTGAPDATIMFPKNGGSDSTISINLSRYIIVNNASVDIEGRPKLYDPVQGSIDYNNPGLSTAWDSTTNIVPPNAKPVTYETTNITIDPGIKGLDNLYYASRSQQGTPLHMFEFFTGDLVLTNLSMGWVGNGQVTSPTGTGPQYGADLYIYLPATNTWKKESGYVKSTGDQVLWANETVGDLVDSRGFVTFMVLTATAIGVPGSTAQLMTNYVKMWYNGTENFCPYNAKLDLNADGSTEWQYTGRLANKTTFSGDTFVTALQAILDAATGNSINVKLKFTVEKGGMLFVSNLTIDYTFKDLPPTFVPGNLRYEIDEDTNATALINLRSYFNDDKGVNNLVFTVIWEEDASRLHAALNADGYHVDISTMLKDWNGQERFRVNASDASGQSIESNNFTVVVNPVNDGPKLKQPANLGAREGTLFEYSLNATDVDLASDPEEKLTFSTNATYMTLNADTGKLSFTPKNSDVGPHGFWVRVTDKAGLCDTKTISLTVENLNNPPTLLPIDDITTNEDEPFSMKVSATDPDLDIGLDELTFEDNSSLFQIAKNGTIAFTPQNKDVGFYMVSVTVKDSGGLTDTKNFTITVVNVNDPPKINPVANMTVNEDEKVSFKVTATDEDVGDTLSFKDDSPLFDITPAGLVNFTPLQKDVGIHTFNITVTDAGGLKASFQMTITVLNVNDPPVAKIKSPANGTAYNFGANITFEGNATDVDGDVLTFSWSDNGAALGTGQSFSSKKLTAGKHTISLTVSDGTVEVPGGTIEITVKAKKPAEKGLPGFELGLALLGLAAAAVLGRRRK